VAHFQRRRPAASDRISAYSLDTKLVSNTAASQWLSHSTGT